MTMEGRSGEQSQPEIVSRGRYAKGIKRRQQILDRAIEVFAEAGFEGTSLRAIGEAIGVSHAALRRYFDSREELFLEVLREKDLQALKRARDLHQNDLGLADGLDDFASHVPGLMALRHSMVARALEPGNERSRDFFVARYDSFRGEAIESLYLAREAGAVSDRLPLPVVAALVVAAVDGLSTQWLLDKSVDMHASIELLESLIAPIAETGHEGDSL
jgi:AcrR family transcriptional regulator